MVRISGARQITFGRRQNAVCSGHGFDHHGRDGVRTLVLDDLLEIDEIVACDLLLGLPEREVVGPRIHHMDVARTTGLVGPPPGIPGELHTGVGAAVVAPITSQDLLPPGVVTGGPDGVLVGLGPTQRKEEGVDVAGNDLGQQLANPRPDLGRRPGVDIDQGVELLLDGGNHLGVAVANEDAHHLRVEVDDAPSVGGVEVDPLGPLDGQGVDRPGGGPGVEGVLLTQIDNFVRIHGDHPTLEASTGDDGTRPATTSSGCCSSTM